MVSQEPKVCPIVDFLITSENNAQCAYSLVPRPFPAPVLDRLQYRGRPGNKGKPLPNSRLRDKIWEWPRNIHELVCYQRLVNETIIKWFIYYPTTHCLSLDVYFPMCSICKQSFGFWTWDTWKCSINNTVSCSDPMLSWGMEWLLNTSWVDFNYHRLSHKHTTSPQIWYFHQYWWLFLCLLAAHLQVYTFTLQLRYVKKLLDTYTLQLETRLVYRPWRFSS